MEKNFEIPEENVVPLVLNGPECWNGWIHGFSPRFYKNPSGGVQPLNPGMENVHRGSLKHRDAFLYSLGIQKRNLFLMNQVHGDSIIEVTEKSLLKYENNPPEADAAITSLLEQPLGVMTADCVPVLVYDPITRAVGAVHAGRKGTSLNILRKTVIRMQECFGSDPARLQLALGPAIRGCCYEVDDKCVQPFRNSFPEVDSFVSRSDKGAFMLDLIEANIQDALTAGVLRKNMVLSGECTACNLERWYSYRKEGKTGRMVAVAMLKAGE